MTNRPYTNISGYAALLVIPFVCLLIWLFNAHCMGRINKNQYRVLTVGASILLVVGFAATLILSR